MANVTLATIDRTLKTLGILCGALAAAAVPGLISASWAVGFGLAGLVLNGLAGSPLFDPTLIGKQPWTARVLATLSVLAGLVSASSYFPAVQHLMSEGHAQKLAALVLFVAQFAARFTQSPIIAGGTVGAGPGHGV